MYRPLRPSLVDAWAGDPSIPVAGVAVVRVDRVRNRIPTPYLDRTLRGTAAPDP
jgi:hypothetical protein